MMTNSDLGRLLKSFEIQGVLRAPMYVAMINENRSRMLSLRIANVKRAVR